VLAKLIANEGDLSVKHLGGVRRPAPSAGSCEGQGQDTQRTFVLRAGSGHLRPARARFRVTYNKQLRNIKTCASG
jgi:hypothetical protein